jgi:hypothetical protein
MAPQEALQSNDDCVDQAEDPTKIPSLTASSSRKKSVVFRNFVDFKWIPNLDDYAEMELCSIWYSEFEYRLMRNDCLETISKMRGHFPEDDSNCYRRFERSARRTRAIRKRAQIAVCRVQERQWNTHEYEYIYQCIPEAIAAAYLSCTGCSSFEAFRRGLEDAD